MAISKEIIRDIKYLENENKKLLQYIINTDRVDNSYYDSKIYRINNNLDKIRTLYVEHIQFSHPKLYKKYLKNTDKFDNLRSITNNTIDLVNERFSTSKRAMTFAIVSILAMKIANANLSASKLTRSSLYHTNTTNITKLVHKKQVKQISMKLATPSINRSINRTYAVDKYIALVEGSTNQAIKQQAIKDTNVILGKDLLTIMVEDTACPICAPNESVIFSVSGNGHPFPPDLPLHPNCRCEYHYLSEEELAV